MPPESTGAEQLLSLLYLFAGPVITFVVALVATW